MSTISKLYFVLLCVFSYTVSSMNTRYMVQQKHPLRKPQHTKSIACRIIDTRKQMVLREQMINKNSKIQSYYVPEMKNCIR
jgi:hypothetical protein